MTVRVEQGDALNLVTVEDESVDLVVTSPPYFALRVYKDSGEVLEAVGNEDSPEGYLKSLDKFMEEMWRVLKPSGSVFVVLGDKFAGSGGHNNSNITDDEDRGPKSYNKESGTVRPKSLMGLPWRFAIRQIDAGWILRQELIWSKPNGMPESVRDRCRRSHEQVFHFTKNEKYYAAIDRIRTVYDSKTAAKYKGGQRENARAEAGEHNTGPLRDFDDWADGTIEPNPLGALPPSVWSIATSGLRIPKEVIAMFQADKHYAAYPPELVKRIVVGWSPEGVCTVCGEGRVPINEKTGPSDYEAHGKLTGDSFMELGDSVPGKTKQGRQTRTANGVVVSTLKAADTQYAGDSCLCGEWSMDDSLGFARKVYTSPTPEPPTTPAVVLDPFGGVGTTALVASLLNRDAITIDLSAGYTRLAAWRLFISDHGPKLLSKWAKQAKEQNATSTNIPS